MSVLKPEEELTAVFKRMVDDGVSLALELDPLTAFMLIGTIQLALRHPGWAEPERADSPTLSTMRTIVQTLQTMLVDASGNDPIVAAVIDMGWQGKYDV